jgi:hypothetical protein
VADAVEAYVRGVGSFVEPRSAVPGPRAETERAQEADGPSPAHAAAGIATGVLCLWAPFTVVIAIVQSDLPTCPGSSAAICTRLGHLAGMWTGTATAVLGLAVAVGGCWVWGRRHQALFALVAVAVAAAGLLVTLGLANSTP